MLMNLFSYKISGRKMLSCLLASFCISAVAQESSIGNPSGAIQKSSRAKAKVAYVNEDANAVEYTLSGYSIFKYDEETESYENVYMYGGDHKTYPVYVNINKSDNTVKIENLLELGEDVTEVNALNGTYDPDQHTIVVKSPESGAVTDYQFVGSLEDLDKQLRFVAGNMYGVGYWKNVNDMTFKVSDDFKRIVPLSGFSAQSTIKNSKGDWIFYREFYDVMFNCVLYQKGTGVNIIASTDEVNIVKAFPGHNVTKTFKLFNSGTTATDYTIESDNEAFTLSNDFGTLEAGKEATITLNFSPDKTGEYTANLTVYTETGTLTLKCNGVCENIPDYTSIVSEGSEYMTFDTSDEYPWIITNEITDSNVAVSSNKDNDNSSSVLTTNVTVPKGYKGTFKYEGYFDPYTTLSDKLNMTCDDEPLADSPKGIGKVEGETVLCSGTHTITFDYSKGLKVEGMFEKGNDYTYLDNLSLKLEAVEDDAFSINKDEISFDDVFLDKEEITGTNTDVIIRNEGDNELKINGSVSDGIFSIGNLDVLTIKPQKTMVIPVEYKANAVGDYTGNVVLNTSAGDIKIGCKLSVLELPDFASIVDEGDFTFSTDKECPFLVKDGVAYNSNAKKNDTEETWCTFEASFVVPKGKVGEVEWTGVNDSEPGVEKWGFINDGTMIYIDQELPAMAGGRNRDVSYSALFSSSDLHFKEGSHTITFQYYQCGDEAYEGEDMVKFSHLKLKLRDEVDNAVSFWTTDNVDIDSTFVGRSNTSTITIVNQGTKPLSVNSFTCDGPFSASFDTSHAIASYSSADITIAFTPETAGITSGNIVINTSAGDLKVNCSGLALDGKYLLLYEDFEKEPEGWTFLDNDNDGKGFSWLNNNSFAHNGSNGCIYTRSGAGCLNYAVSPEFSVPEAGAILSYYRRNNGDDVENDHYEVLVGEGADPTSYTSLYGEYVPESTWLSGEILYDKRYVDISAFAGKTVRIAFLNNDVERQDVLFFDDVMCYSKEVSTGISGISKDNGMVSKTFYTLSGTPVSNPQNGVYIMKSRNANGEISAKKIFIK